MLYYYYYYYRALRHCHTASLNNPSLLRGQIRRQLKTFQFREANMHPAQYRHSLSPQDMRELQITKLN